MKFSHKVFFSTLIIIALVFSIGSSILIDSVFRASMEREERLTLDENQMLRLSFATAAASAMTNSASYGLLDALSDSAVRRVAWTLENSNGYCIRISDAARDTLYVSDAFQGDKNLTGEAEDDLHVWVCFADETGYYIQSACSFTVGEKTFYLENLRDVTDVVRERQRYLRLYQLLALCLMGVSAVVMLLFSMYLTRPMKRLSAVSRRIAGGEYQLRCAATSHDEIGALTEDFNAMADSMETKIHQLEDAAQSQEDFIASFAHELKTPLTSIIGYSDMLRAQMLPPEQQFKAANYIYTEGKRLESLAHKLLDLIIYHRQTLRLEKITAKPWLEEIAALLQPGFAQQGVLLTLQADAGVILGESDLLKSMVINLCDNAQKASEQGGTVELLGKRGERGYCITVRDHGCGIAPEEMERITEPFYMVDKSRARAQNGAGLGLALCKAVAELHGTALRFDSVQGEGTVVSVVLREVRP